MKRILLLLVIFCALSAYQVFAAEDFIEQQNFSVSAAVPPQNSDYTLSLAAIDDKTPVVQNTRLGYIITYGAQATAGFTAATTLIADWRSSDAMTNVGILDYVLGSATNAYGNITPVVDLINRTITWNMPALPPGADNQTVQFDVRTNTNYTGNNEIPFTIRANMNNQYVTMPEQSVTKTYIYAQNYVENPPPPTTPTPTTSPPSAPGPSLPRITNVAFTSITATTATLLIDTDRPVTVRVSYGTSSLSFPSSITTAEYALRNIVTLDNLKPATPYYLRITITDSQGLQRTSEIFTFQTAKSSIPPNLEENIIILTTGGNILISDIQRKRAVSQIALLTVDSEYEFTYAIRNRMTIKSIDAVVRNKVLGITEQAYAQESTSMTVPMRERTPSVFVATLKTVKIGFFEVSIRIVDANGNISEEKIAELKVIPYFSVLEEGTQNPIADGRVYFSFYNMNTGKFEPLSPQLFKNIPNPTYTDLRGDAKVTLPIGRYRAHISAFSYAERTVDFTLGINPGEDFPRVLLKRDPWNLLGYLRYYGYAISDLFNNITTVVTNLANSVRFFNLLASFILIVTIMVTFYFFTLRTRVYFSHLLPFFKHHVKTIVRKQPLGTFCAIITDEQGRRLKGALISVLDDTTGELLTSIASNTIGICYLFNPKEHKNLKLLIIKQGYMPKTVAIQHDIADTPNGLTIMLRRGHRPDNPALANMVALLEIIAGRFFEISLFISLVLEVFFMSIYGLGVALPFFVLSLFNLLLWILYQKEKEERKVFKKS